MMDELIADKLQGKNTLMLAHILERRITRMRFLAERRKQESAPKNFGADGRAN